MSKKPDDPTGSVLSTKSHGSTLRGLFYKFYSIPKVSSLNIFKKKSDYTEETIMEAISAELDVASTFQLYSFLVEDTWEIKFFFFLSFYPANKNRRLKELCQNLSIQLFAIIAEVYFDFTTGRCDFGPGNSLAAEISKDKRKENLVELYQTTSCLVSMILSPSLNHVHYRMKVEKLKVFKNLEYRLQEQDKNATKEGKDFFTLLKERILQSVIQEKNDDRLLSKVQGWFDLFGGILEKTEGRKIGLIEGGVIAEVVITVKRKDRLVSILDEYFVILLGKENYKVALISLMEKNTASYIKKMLESNDRSNPKDKNVLDLTLLKMIFELTNKLFQTRQSIFGSNVDEDEADYFYSGASNSDDMRSSLKPHLMTLNKELSQEEHSFKKLQKSTGFLYLYMIDQLMDERTTEEDVKICGLFDLFLNKEGFISYLEVFEPSYSAKLVKNVFTCLSQYVEQAASSPNPPHLRLRIGRVFKINSCMNQKTCTCFICDIVNILFKLSIKCPSSAISVLMDGFRNILKNLFQFAEYKKNVATCYFKNFTKTFMSLLKQNFQSVDEMTIQSIFKEDSSSSENTSNNLSRHQSSNTNASAGSNPPKLDQYTVMDLRKTVSISPLKFNLFLDYIRIEGEPVRVSKELCESILMILTDGPGVKEYLGGEMLRIDLDMDERYYLSSSDISELLQNRWQVRLLAFRTILLETTAKLIQMFYYNDECDFLYKEVLSFMDELTQRRGMVLHSFYLGFVAKTFTSYFLLGNYKKPQYFKYLTVMDIYLKGLGFYDRDTRLALPMKIQKEVFSMMLNVLKIKTEINNSKLLGVQLLMSIRLSDMLTRDLPIVKSLLPLSFDVAKETLHNFKEIDVNDPDLITAVKSILHFESASVKEALLYYIVKIFVTCYSVGANYKSMPLVLKPHVMANGKLVVAGGFDFRTLGDIADFLVRKDQLKLLIDTIDQETNNVDIHLILTKYLSIISVHRACERPPQKLPDSLSDLNRKPTERTPGNRPSLEKSTDSCQECLLSISLDQLIKKPFLPNCPCEIFKMRMKLLITLLTINSPKRNVIDACDLLTFIEGFEKLFLLAKKRGDRSVSNVKKQWFFTVLIKWVYLSSSPLPTPHLDSLLSSLTLSPDDYMAENCTIFQSYLKALRGTHQAGVKTLREASFFDEQTILPRNMLLNFFRLIKKFSKRQSFEEEARVLQAWFDVNLFDYFNEDKRLLTFSKILEDLLTKVKTVDHKWVYIYDQKNVILYSLAETDKNELCIIKRHIAGKNCWFLQERFDELFASYEKLENLDNTNLFQKQFEREDTPEPLLARMNDLYRENPESFDYYSSQSIDEHLNMKKQTDYPQRSSKLAIYPSYLQHYFKVSDRPEAREAPFQAPTIPSPSVNPVDLSLHTRGDTSEDSDSQADSTKWTSKGGSFNQNSESKSNLSHRRKAAVGSFLGVTDPKIRFLLQFGLFNLPNEKGDEYPDISSFYLISPTEEQKNQFKTSLNYIDKKKILNCFKVGILFVTADQTHENQFMANDCPATGRFADFVSNLGEKQGESVFVKSLGNDEIHYQIGPLIPKKPGSCFEAKRIVCNSPTLIIWTQNPRNINYESIKTKFNRDLLIIEELSTGLLRVTSYRKLEESRLEGVIQMDIFINQEALTALIPSYIFSSQMEIYPQIFKALANEYKTISPYLEARKKKIRELIEVYNKTSTKIDFDTLCDILFDKMS